MEIAGVSFFPDDIALLQNKSFFLLALVQRLQKKLLVLKLVDMAVLVLYSF